MGGREGRHCVFKLLAGEGRAGQGRAGQRDLDVAHNTGRGVSCPVAYLRRTTCRPERATVQHYHMHTVTQLINKARAYVTYPTIALPRCPAKQSVLS